MLSAITEIPWKARNLTNIIVANVIVEETGKEAWSSVPRFELVEKKKNGDLKSWDLTLGPYILKESIH